MENKELICSKSFKPEWIPKNPCPCGCIRYPDGHKCYMEDDNCIEIAKYEGAIIYLKKLFDHLLNSPGSVNKTQLRLMLQKLEDINEITSTP